MMRGLMGPQRIMLLVASVTLLAMSVGAAAQRVANGQLTITSDPAGSAITLDGLEMPEVTPWGPVELPEGQHIVILRHPDFPDRPKRVQVTVRAGTMVTAHAKFGNGTTAGSAPPIPALPDRFPATPPPAPPRVVVTPPPAARMGALRIESVPDGAAVFIDGERKGFTPLDQPSIKEGSYNVRLEADGYPPRTATVRVVAGKMLSTKLTLARERPQAPAGIPDVKVLVIALVVTSGVLIALIAFATRRRTRGTTGSEPSWSGSAGPLIVGDYGVDRNAVIAVGGMATLYKAMRRTGRREVVAVKIPHPQYQSDADFIEAFRREGGLGEMLHNENIIKIHDSGTTAQGVTYIAMELVEGVDLHRLISSGLSIEDAVDIATQIGRALDYAHSKQVFHCDVKPGNVLLRGPRPYRVVLTDFGIARAGHQTNPSGDVITGTPDYLAPEVIMRRPPGAASDLYALGIVLYEMLAKRKPFVVPDNDPKKIMDLQISSPPPPLASLNGKVPATLESIVMRLLAKAPEDRYPSAEALINDLQSFARKYSAGS
jgi:serine/threonine-protein kinase